AFLVQRLAVPVAPPAAGAPAPRLLPLLTRGRVVIPLLTAALPAKVVLAGFLFYLVPLALAGADYSPASTGRAMMLYFVLVAAANPLASWLSDRFGWQRSLVIAGGLVIGAGGVLGLLDRIETLFAGIVALGLGTGLSAAALQALASRDGPAAIVLLRTVERLGAVIGPLFVGSLLAVTAWSGAMATVGATMLVATLAFALWARAAASLDTPDKEPS
ncbi:MAG TPA: MFS transporter, partial [Rhodocyclaceae bacterium]|nr:MFS transporter [Rhodocyclaceae bacterium]